MRRFLAVVTLGVVLPLAAVSAARASDNVDYQPFTFVQASEPATATDTDSGVVAGPSSGQYFGPYFDQRQDNIGQ
jgi:hypothetical protein